MFTNCHNTLYRTTTTKTKQPSNKKTSNIYNSVQCIKIVEKVASVMMWNCGVTLLRALKVAEGGSSGTAEEL